MFFALFSRVQFCITESAKFALEHDSPFEFDLIYHFGQCKYDVGTTIRISVLT